MFERMRETGSAAVDINKMLRAAARIIAILLFFFVLTVSSSSAFGADSSADRPDITAKGAILYCANTDTVLYAKESNTKYAPYSITKLMTAILVTENMSFDKKVTVSEKAAGQEGSSMGLKAGEVLTVGQLMHGLLILSGNDAAWALAEAYPGGEPAFVDAMNARAEKLGCKNTHFANPNGLDDDDHYSTASDFLKISRAAFANSTVKKIAGTKRYSMAATNMNSASVFKTHTDLLATKGSGVIAGKTGYGEEDDCSIAAEYLKKDLNLYVVLLGDTTKQRPKDMVKLFEYAKDVLGRTTVTTPDKCVKKLWVRHGEKTLVKTYTSRNVYAYYTAGSRPGIKTRTVMYEGVTAPLKKGERVGTYKVYTNGHLTASAPIVVKESVDAGWLLSYLYISVRGFAVMLLAAVIMYVLVRSRRARRRSMRRRKAYMGKHDRGRRVN